MWAQAIVLAGVAAFASAGLATSYAVGGIGLGGHHGGLGGSGGLASLGGGGLGGLGGGLGHGVGIIGVGHHATVVDYHTPAHYDFNYGVHDGHTGDNKQQSEQRVGDHVRGSYSLAEPDGTIRVVHYTADDHNGFNAVVERRGHAVHPQVHVVAHGIGNGYGHGGY